jgi:DinB superfamily
VATAKLTTSEEVMDFSLELGKEVLHRTPDVLRAMLADVSDHWTSAAEEPESWSPYQVVGHLTYVEECDWIDRTRLILDHGTERVLEPVDREAGFTQFAGWKLTDLLDRFASVRTSNLEALDDLVEVGDLVRRGVHPTFGEVTVSQLLATWVVHDLNHLGQAVKTMAKEYREAVGPWRESLPILDAP